MINGGAGTKEAFEAEAHVLGGKMIEQKEVGTVSLAVVEIPDAMHDGSGKTIWLTIMHDTFGVGSRRATETRPDTEYLDAAIQRHVCQSQSYTRRN